MWLFYKMKKTFKTISHLFVLLFICSGFLANPVLAESPNSRTFYDGYVEIERTSIPDIKAKLDGQGCHFWIAKKYDEYHGCLYTETNYENDAAIQIYPHGGCFGVCSFYLTENKLVASKDIAGKPNLENYQKEIRQDLKNIGNIVMIKEDSWKNIKMKYPWDVVY